MEFVWSDHLHSGFVVGPNWIVSVLHHLVIHQNTQLNAEIKYQASNRQIFRVIWAVLTVSSFVLYLD